MIKSIYCMNRPPEISIAECLQHWYEVHGKHHVGPGTKLISYIQHQTLLAAYHGSPKPTHVGASIVTSRDLAHLTESEKAPSWAKAAEDSNTGLDGRPVFTGKSAVAIGTEKVVKDGEVNGIMVKAMPLASLNPEQNREEALKHWQTVVGPLGAKVPGIRKYVQNHPLEEARGQPRITHDGWSEMWFDDLESYQAAMKTPQWAEMVKAAESGLKGKPIFVLDKMAFVIGRERQMVPGAGKP